MAECTCADPTMVAERLSENPKETVAGTTKQASKDLQATLASEERSGKSEKQLVLSNCDWAAPEYGGIGEGYWTQFFQAAALVIAIANGVAQGEIADMRQDLADKYYDMAKYKWDRFKNKYMPLEKELLGEVSSVPMKDIDCAGARDRAQQAVTLAYDGIDNYLGRITKSYRLCIDPSLVQYNDNRRNIMQVDTENYNLSDERWFVDVKNDQRWNRRSNVLNLGRNLATESMKYGDVANALLKQVGSQIDRAAGTMIQAFGYYGARNDTFYPQGYLNSAPGMITTPTAINPTGGG